MSSSFLKTAVPFLLSALMALACQSPTSPRADSLIPLRGVSWNPSKQDIKDVIAVADAGKIVGIFRASSVSLLVDGSLVATIPHSPGWVDAAVVPALDESGTWIVGVDQKGTLWRVRDQSSLEEVTARYGLGGPVRELCAAPGGRLTAFLLPSGVAVADAVHLRLYPATFQSIACGLTSVIGVKPDSVSLLTEGAASWHTYALPGARAAMGADGHLVVSVKDHLYVESSQGTLEDTFTAEHPLRVVAAANQGAWVLDGARLTRWEGGSLRASELVVPSPEARLIPSSSGGIWELDHGSLQRFEPHGEPQLPAHAAGAAPVVAGVSWDSELRPVFQRSCVPCHDVRGSAGFELTSLEAWQKNRGAIEQTVLQEHSMPPPGTPLSDADRETIHRWVMSGR